MRYLMMGNITKYMPSKIRDWWGWQIKKDWELIESTIADDHESFMLAPIIETYRHKETGEVRTREVTF